MIRGGRQVPDRHSSEFASAKSPSVINKAPVSLVERRISRGRPASFLFARARAGRKRSTIINGALKILAFVRADRRSSIGATENSPSRSPLASAFVANVGSSGYLKSFPGMPDIFVK